MDAHRKIELQSPADLTHIESNIRNAARQKLDLHLPPIEGSAAGEDDLRKKVEEKVDEFVREVQRGLRSNVQVNGLDADMEGIEGGVMGEGEEGEFFSTISNYSHGEG